MIQPIQAGEVAGAWYLAERWVRSACEEGALVETVDSYKARCLEGSAQLWLIVDSDVVCGCCLTEIYSTAKGLTCAIPVAAAASMDACLEDVIATIERWARAEGCVRLEGFGRLGWVRALKPHGWRPLTVVIEKDI